MDRMLEQCDRLMDDIIAGDFDRCGDADSGKGDWLGYVVREHLATGGKRLRARLAIAATIAQGGSQRAALAWGAACELAHNATLIHDDVQDGDRVRRGRPTTWVKYGIAQAINAGDLLFMAPYGVLTASGLPAEQCWELAQILQSHLATVIRGQAMECNLLADGQTDRAIYDRTIRGKTSALFEMPVWGAVRMSGADSTRARQLTAPFADLGMLFQMQDDVLDLYGDKGRGRRGADLAEGKVSALVVAHLARVPADRDALLALLRTPREHTSAAQIEHQSERFRDSGALAEVLANIEAFSQRAQRDVDPCFAAMMAELLALVRRPIAHLLSAA